MLLNCFNNSDDNTKLFGASARKSVFAFTLTDQVKKQVSPYDIKNTLEAGQRYEMDGKTPINPNPDGRAEK
jgi:hypothetical protein